MDIRLLETYQTQPRPARAALLPVTAKTQRLALLGNCRWRGAGGGGVQACTHDCSRQRGTACPLLYRYRLTHAYCSLARLPPTHPFVARPFSNGIFRSNGAPASLPFASSALTHTRRMDGFCNQNADQLGSLAGLSFPAVYVGVVDCAPASPYTYSSSTHRFPDERTPIEATTLSATSAELGLGLGLGLGLDSL